MQKRIGVQLYSVRRELAKDFTGVIQAIAGMWYDGVELAGLPPGITPADATALFDSLRLTVASGHFGLPIGENASQVIDGARALGCGMIVSSKGPDNFKTPDLVKRTCEELNEAAANADKAGMRLAYHNHWWEFGNVEGHVVFDQMLDLLDPRVCFEVDTYWVKTGGGDPAKVVTVLGRRAPLLHIKDGPCVSGQPMVAVGKGAMEFAPILAAGRHAEWLVVEIDECATDMLKAVQDSVRYLRGFSNE